MGIWKAIDSSHELPHILETDKCSYAREYQREGSYQAGETNQMVFNFKKDGSKRDLPEWIYRNRDVKKFALELSSRFKEDSKMVITAVPSSKAKNDPLYSNRFEDLFDELKILRPSLVIEWPIEASATVQAAHEGGTRDPDVVMKNYCWKGFENEKPLKIVIVDDIITTGSRFRAMSKFLRDNDYKGEIYGIFWARTV